MGRSSEISVRLPLFVLSLFAALALGPRARAQELLPPRLAQESVARYPSVLEGSGRSAEVALDLTIDRDGLVSAVDVIASGGEAFDAAAREAATKLVFEPAKRGDNAIVAVVRYTFRFSDPIPAKVPADAPALPAPVAPAPPASAGEAPEDATPMELTVVGERAPREATVRVLEREEIRTVPGTGGDVLRAVETMPGVARPPGLGPDIIVRGSAPQDTQVFVDGTWIPVAYHFGGIRTVLPAELLERLDFYPGNFGPQYGRGTGGVIDVGIRSPRKDRLGGVAQLDVIDGRLLVEGPLGSKTRFLVAGRRSWVDAWIGPVLESSGSDVRTAPVYYDYQAVLEHDISSRTTARLLWFGSDDRLALTLNAGSAANPLFSGNFGTFSKFQRLQGRVDTRLEGGGRIVSMASWGTQGEGFFLGDQFVDASYHLVNARSDVRVPLGKRVAVGGGVDVFYGTYDVSLRLTPYPGADEVAGPYFARPPRRVEGSGGVARPGAYALLELRPTGGLVLLPSVRADYTQDTDRATLDPRFSGRWDLTSGFPRTTIKSAVGIYHQPPQPVESVPPFGTPGVRGSAALHASTGFEQEIFRGVELSVEGYTKRLDDLVVARASENDTAIGARFENTGSGKVLGAEALLRAKVGRLSGSIAYSISRSTRRNADSEPFRLAAWDQTHVASAVASLNLGRGFTAGGRFRFVTGVPVTPYVGAVGDFDAGAYAPVPGARNSERMPHFHQLDLRIEKTWRIGQSAKVAAYLDLQNATNRKNPEGFVYRYDYARKDVAAGLPILPVLGLRGEL